MVYQLKRSVYACAIVFLMLSCSKESVEVPFSYERNIYVKSVINDSIIGNFMFDTGAWGLYFDSLYNKRPSLGYNYYFAQNSESGGNLKLKFAVNAISFIPEYFRPIQTKPSFGKQCDGIVGWDLFKDHVLEVDYINSKLKITNANDFEIDKSYTKIPLIFNNNSFYVNLDIAVTDRLTVSGKYLFDLGYGGSIYFTGETVNKYQIDSIGNKKVEFGVDWGTLERRKSVGFVLRGKRIKIENFELIEPTLECSKDVTGVLSGGEYVGLLGNRALDHFDVVIDFVNKELYLRPNANYTKRMKFKSIGVGFVDRTDICEGFIVNSIYLNSEADKAGVRSGDIITHFDGKSVKMNSAKMIKDFYENVGKDVLITFLREDSVFKLNLKVKEQL